MILFKTMHNMLLTFACLMIGLSTTTVAFAEKRVALVIGNNSYTGTHALANPVNDANLISKVLEHDLGFEVSKATNLDRRAMYDAFRKTAQNGKDADVLVVYYSGHAVQRLDGNYLLPVDAQIQDYDDIGRDALAVDDIVRTLQATQARVVLLILDSCRDYAYGTKSTSKGLARMGNVSGKLLIAFATQESATASDGKGKNSPYAQALAKHLPRTNLPVLEVFDEIAEAVSASTNGRQRPTRYGDMPVRTCLLQGKCTANQVNHAAIPVAATPATDERGFWASIKDQVDPRPFLRYQVKFPDGVYRDEARQKGGRILRTQSGCGVLDSALSKGNKMDWSGDCQDGLANRQGRMTFWTDDEKHSEWTGSMTLGIASGSWEGLFFSPQKPGDFRKLLISYLPNGQIAAKKIAYLNNGAIYEGETDTETNGPYGQPHGKGKMFFSNGDEYEGDWLKGQRTGRGEMRFAKKDGADPALKYVGEFLDGKFNGTGTMTWASGTTSTGMWRDGKRNGRNKLIKPDGDIFEVDYTDEKMTGRGVRTFPKKDDPNAPATYVGEFKDGKFDGEGTLTFNNGATYIGQWLQDKRHGNGRQIEANGNIYNGQWANNLRNGEGSFYVAKPANPNALISYVGSFQAGFWSGRGTMTFANGASYTGEFQNGNPHGYGEIKWADGKTARGQFDQNRNPFLGPIRPTQQ